MMNAMPETNVKIFFFFMTCPMRQRIAAIIIKAPALKKNPDEFTIAICKQKQTKVNKWNIDFRYVNNDTYCNLESIF